MFPLNLSTPELLSGKCQVKAIAWQQSRWALHIGQRGSSQPVRVDHLCASWRGAVSTCFHLSQGHMKS